MQGLSTQSEGWPPLQHIFGLGDILGRNASCLCMKEIFKCSVGSSLEAGLVSLLDDGPIVESGGSVSKMRCVMITVTLPARRCLRTWNTSMRELNPVPTWFRLRL
jgi:hypothetical protein